MLRSGEKVLTAFISPIVPMEIVALLEGPKRVHDQRFASLFITLAYLAQDYLLLSLGQGRGQSARAVDVVYAV